MSAGGHSFHKKDWLLTAAAVAAAATGAGMAGIGPLAGAFGGGAGAAGAGAAGAAEGAGAGLLGLGGGTAASAFGPTAAQAGLMSTFAPTAAEAATPFLTGLSTAPAVGGSSMFGAGMAADTLGGLGITPGMSEPSLWSKAKPFMDTLEKVQKFQKLANGGQEQQQMPPPIARPPQQAQSGQELQALSQLFANPVGQEQLKRILRMQGIAV